MRTTLRSALIVVIFSLPAWAEAAIWSAVISTGKMRAEMDIASFMRQGNIVTAWEREVYSEPEQARPGDFYFKSTKALIRYSCDVRTADMLMKVYYADDGSEIKTISASFYGRPNYVIPDTDAEQKFEYACNYRKVSERKPVIVSKKKVVKDKDKEKTGKDAEKKAGKSESASKSSTAKGESARQEPPRQPPRSLPIHKPSEIRFRAPPAEPDKEAAKK
jgi:hypothetical protein